MTEKRKTLALDSLHEVPSHLTESFHDFDFKTLASLFRLFLSSSLDMIAQLLIQNVAIKMTCINQLGTIFGSLLSPKAHCKLLDALQIL